MKTLILITGERFWSWYLEIFHVSISSELEFPGTSQAQYLQHSLALAYLAHFFLFTLMQNHVYKRSRQKIALVRLCVPAGWYTRIIVKGGWCCLLNEINPTTTTDLDKLQLSALRFIGFGKKNRVLPRLIFATDTFLEKLEFGGKASFTCSFACTWAMLNTILSWWGGSQSQRVAFLSWSEICPATDPDSVSQVWTCLCSSGSKKLFHVSWKDPAPWHKGCQDPELQLQHFLAFPHSQSANPI